MVILGADLSHYQSANLAQARSAISFVVLKATEGTGYVDPTMTARRQQAHAAGLVVGLYHFARAGNAAAEAAYFLRTIGALQPGEFLVLDWEVPGANPPGWCKQWLDAVYAATGVRPLIYMNQSAVNGSNWSAVAADYGLWLAKYDGSTAQPSVAYWGGPAMKQYSDKGQVPGIGACDVDVFYGTTDQLLKYGKQAGPQPAPQVLDELETIMGWYKDRADFEESVQRAVLMQTPTDRTGAWPYDRIVGTDDKTGEINDAVKAVVDAIGKVQTPVIDEAKLAAALLSDPAAVAALGKAIADNLQLSPRAGS